MKPTLQTLFAQIRAHIARDEMPAALSSLRGLLDNTPRLNEILQQSGRLENIRQQIRTGTVSHNDATLEQNRIRFGVLELLTNLEKDMIPTALSDLLAAVEQESTQPEVHEEVVKAVSIVNSKNVVLSSSITAGGDVHIGDKTTHITQTAEKIYNIKHIDNANFS